QAIVSSQPGGARDLLAVVLQSWTPSGGSGALEYQLQLLDITPTGFGSVRAEVPLWNGPRAQPLIASAPEGGRLAIVGNPENAILVYSVVDLLQKRPHLQILRGVGESIVTATFVRHGTGDWGLLIRRTPQADPVELVFDLTNRRFSPSAAGWSVALP